MSSGLGSGAKRAKALGVEPIDLSGDDSAGAASAGEAAAGDAAAAAADASAADAWDPADASDVDADAPRVLAPENPEPVAPLFTTVTSKLPHWSENRRAAKEKAERLAKAIADLSRRDKSDPEGAAFGDDAKEEAARLAAERAENGDKGGNTANGGNTDDGDEPGNAERPEAD